MADTEQGTGGEAATIRAEHDAVFPPLRDLAAELGGHSMSLMVGYAHGYTEAMLAEGNLSAAREKLDWMKSLLTRSAQEAQELRKVKQSWL
jgi:hypothetical protein